LVSTPPAAGPRGAVPSRQRASWTRWRGTETTGQRLAPGVESPCHGEGPEVEGWLGRPEGREEAREAAEEDPGRAQQTSHSDARRARYGLLDWVGRLLAGRRAQDVTLPLTGHSHEAAAPLSILRPTAGLVGLDFGWCRCAPGSGDRVHVRGRGVPRHPLSLARADGARPSQRHSARTQ
jgi:hypothetical protein